MMPLLPACHRCIASGEIWAWRFRLRFVLSDLLDTVSIVANR